MAPDATGLICDANGNVPLTTVALKLLELFEWEGATGASFLEYFKGKFRPALDTALNEAFFPMGQKSGETSKYPDLYVRAKTKEQKGALAHVDNSGQYKSVVAEYLCKYLDKGLGPKSLKGFTAWIAIKKPDARGNAEPRYLVIPRLASGETVEFPNVKVMAKSQEEIDQFIKVHRPTQQPSQSSRKRKASPGSEKKKEKRGSGGKAKAKAQSEDEEDDDLLSDTHTTASAAPASDPLAAAKQDLDTLTDGPEKAQLAKELQDREEGLARTCSTIGAAAAKEQEEREQAKEEAKAALRKIREKITSNQWETSTHTRTNAEQQKCTIKLIDHIEAFKVYKTHYVKDEVAIHSPNGDLKLKIDLCLLAKDPSKHCDIRIECKMKNHKEARGQCKYYSEYELRPEATTRVYSYFPEQQPEDLIDAFARDGTGVLWPGREHTIQFVRV